MDQRKLYLSRVDKYLFGVCGGIGEYLGIDSTIIRILFAFMFVFGGSGMLLYILLWIIIPSKRD